MQFEAEVNAFLANAAERGLRIIMVGGAAVNHHGFKRHSADVFEELGMIVGAREIRSGSV